MQKINDGWEFTEEWSPDFAAFACPAERVRLPHSVKEVGLHYADPADYRMLCGYRRVLPVPADWSGKRLFLQFDAAAHQAIVFVNGEAVAEHRCGYTAFRAELTKAIRFGEDNLITVRLDTSEDPDIPPFGQVVDYLAYGGLYRDVWLDVREKCYIEDIFVRTPTTDSVRIEVTASGLTPGLSLRILDAEQSTVYELGSTQLSPDGRSVFDATLHGAKVWDLDHPNLYTCEVTLTDSDGHAIDIRSVTFGFRTAQFRPDGFYLNGRKTFLRGLNRHQSFPYIGYAAPESLQREDARILKQELGVNAVRTSHYPQSRYFLDECDRLGIAVFTEIPGWQHIGDEAWKDLALENTREMILQYRNHPSIVLWGVRINESQDDDDFYARTNWLAHELDPGRATSGVRFITHSHLLEDVYAFNDFSCNGTGAGVRPKKGVVNKKDLNKPFLISEHNGHMFPTKAFDPWQKRQEQALRHARVLGAAMSSGEHSGCFGWCMFDYQTHRDFGSGDRICYHGVSDAFRNPKPAAAVYASQSEAHPVLELCSPMDIGDYSGGSIGDLYLFTNADSIDLYKNDIFVKSFVPKPLFGLRHEPIPADDLIGELLISQEGMPPRKAEQVRRCLAAVQKHGPDHLPLREKLRFAFTMLRYRMSFADGYRLYGKYAANWGGEAVSWRFDAKKNGQVLASVRRCPNTDLAILLFPGKTVLHEGDCYDMTSVRIRIVDGCGATASYAQYALTLSAEGPLEIVGPETITAEGGMTGTYLKTVGLTGAATLTVQAPGLPPVRQTFLIENP